MSNTVTLVGNLGKDPELKYTTNGKPMVNVTLAVSNPSWGDREPTTTWANLVIFGRQAENVAASLSKGNNVIVTGTLRSYSYENEQGVRINGTQIQVQSIGPSLVFQTAEVKKASPSTGSSSSKAAPADNAPDEEDPF